jgi:Protein of unknown function (DUF1664)
MAGALRTVSLVIGGAGGGSYLYNNVSADGVRSVARDILLRESARDPGRAQSPAVDHSGLDRLAAQVERLSSEVSSSAARPVVVYGGGGGADVSGLFGSLAGWTVVAVAVGTAVYYVCLWRGTSVTDFMWVSRQAFKDTVTGINAGMKNVSATVATIRHDMAEKLRHLETRLENVRSSLSEKMETEVADVKERVDIVGKEVVEAAEMLHAVNSRIELMADKLDTATNGIMALVRVVSSLAPEKLKPESPFVELRRFAEVADKNGTRAIDGSNAFSHRRLPSNSSFAAATLEGPTECSPTAARRASAPHGRNQRLSKR